MGRAIITEEMTAKVYEAAKDIRNGKITRTRGTEAAAEASGMSVGTAQIHITNIHRMLDGARYTHTMSESATRYYIDRISADFGKEAQAAALDAVQGHYEYFEKKSRKQPAIEQLLKEYK